MCIRDRVGIKPDTVIRRNNTILGVNAWTSTNFILYDIPEGIKSKIVLKNVNAPNKFVFQVLSNLIWKVEKNRILFGDLFITELFGLDSDGEVVKVYVFLKNISDKYFVTVDIDTSGHSFPIVVDPSITYQEGASGYSGCYDTYLREDYPSSNCGSNEYLTIGGDGTFWSHILIKFDNINIPPSAIIDYANLQFKLGFVRGEPDAISFRIGILKRNWGEGTATWNTYDGSNSWATAGAEGVGTDIQTDTLIHTTASKSAGDTVIVDITSLFQKVRGIDSVYTDYGFVFDMESYYGSHSSHQYNFYSSENATISDRPILSIECHYADTINKLIFGDYDGSSVKIDSFQYTNNQAGWYDVYIYNTYIEKYFNANGDTTSTPVYMDKDSWKGVRLKNIGLLSVNIFKFADIGDNLVYYDTLNTSDYIINRIKNLFRFNRNTKIR